MVKVIIAEDNLILADILEESLKNSGLEVCGVAYNVKDAIALIDLHRPDIAVLDYRLADGGYGSDISAQLDDKESVGILYISADPLYDVLTEEDGIACIQKPYSITDLLKAIHIVHMIQTGAHFNEKVSTLPKNFYLLDNSDNPYLKAS